MSKSVSDIRQQLDPCMQYMQHAWEHLVIAMGRLPQCIDLNNPDSLISQVVKACNIPDPTNHTFMNDIDKDGTWVDSTVVINDHASRLINVKYVQHHAIGVYSRVVAGDYQAIYFYADGTIIVIDKWNNYKFHMDG